MAVQVRKIQAVKPQRQHKGYNQPEIKIGQDIYILQDSISGLIFSYAYMNEEIAEQVARKFPENIKMSDLAANFKPDYISVSGRTSL